MTHFPLNTAALCQDCSEVGDSLRRCACCGSRSLIALAPVLNREAPLGAYELERALWGVERRESERSGLEPSALSKRSDGVACTVIGFPSI